MHGSVALLVSRAGPHQFAGKRLSPQNFAESNSRLGQIFRGAAPRKAGPPSQVRSRADWLDRVGGAALPGAGAAIPASEIGQRASPKAVATAARLGETNLIRSDFNPRSRAPVLGRRIPRNAGMRWPHAGIRFLILPSTRNKRTVSAAL